MGKSNQKDGFIVQAGILAAAGILCRIIGLLYRSPLAAVIGDEGNGYYQTAYNVYTIVLLLSSYSIPSAISKVIAQKLSVKEFKNAHRVFLCSMWYVLIVGGLASLVLFFAAPLLTKGPAVTVLRFFAPTVFLSGILGVLRGYFQAHRSMVQTSVSQILEQIFNAVISIGAASLLVYTAKAAQATRQATLGAIGSALGTGMGVLTALLFMWGIYRLNRPTLVRRMAKDIHEEESYADIFKTISSVIVPFILSTAIYNLSTFLNQTIYTWICFLQKGMEDAVILTSYGIFSAKAVVISNIPIALASAMSSAVLPNISAKAEQGDMEGARQKTALAVRTTMLIAIPAAVGIGVLAKPITWLLFPQKESVDLAAKLLTALSASIVFYSLSTLTNSILQGIGRVKTPVRNAALALGLQTLIVSALLVFTDLDLYALVLAMVVYSGAMCVLNQLSVRKYMDYRQEWKKTFLAPLCAAALMGVTALLVYRGIDALFDGGSYPGKLENVLALLAAVFAGCLVYAAAELFFGGITEEELQSMPKGRSLARLAKKCRLLK